MTDRAGLRYLLDTNALSEPLRPVPDAVFLERLRQHGHEVATSATVWNEMVFGLERLPPSARRSAVERYLGNLEAAGLPVLPYDRDAARWQGRERARLEALEAQGRPVAYQDAQIASVAGTRGLALVTRNVRRFAVFEGLRVESWFTAARKRS